MVSVITSDDEESATKAGVYYSAGYLIGGAWGFDFGEGALFVFWIFYSNGLLSSFFLGGGFISDFELNSWFYAAYILASKGLFASFFGGPVVTYDLLTVFASSFEAAAVVEEA